MIKYILNCILFLWLAIPLAAKASEVYSSESVDIRFKNTCDPQYTEKSCSWNIALSVVTYHMHKHNDAYHAYLVKQMRDSGMNPYDHYEFGKARTAVFGQLVEFWQRTGSLPTPPAAPAP